MRGCSCAPIVVSIGGTQFTFRGRIQTGPLGLSGRAPIFHSFHVRSPTITIPAEMLLPKLGAKLTDLYRNSDRGLARKRRKAYSPLSPAHNQ